MNAAVRNRSLCSASWVLTILCLLYFLGRSKALMCRHLVSNLKVHMVSVKILY